MMDAIRLETGIDLDDPEWHAEVGYTAYREPVDRDGNWEYQLKEDAAVALFLG
jgi:hypothetical protein